MMRICWVVVASLMLCGCGPVAQFVDQRGEPVGLTQFFGRPLLVSYYAPWCQPCQRELPRLQAMVVEQGVQVLLVSYDANSHEELLRQGAGLSPELPLLRQRADARLPYPRPGALPTSYLLDASGELKETLSGEISEQRAAELVATMLTPLPRPEPWVLFSSKS